jgi:hypothetical protein
MLIRRQLHGHSKILRHVRLTVKQVVDFPQCSLETYVDACHSIDYEQSA